VPDDEGDEMRWLTQDARAEHDELASQDDRDEQESDEQDEQPVPAGHSSTLELIYPSSSESESSESTRAASYIPLDPALFATPDADVIDIDALSSPTLSAAPPEASSHDGLTGPLDALTGPLIAFELPVMPMQDVLGMPSQHALGVAPQDALGAFQDVLSAPQDVFSAPQDTLGAAPQDVLGSAPQDATAQDLFFGALAPDDAPLPSPFTATFGATTPESARRADAQLRDWGLQALIDGIKAEAAGQADRRDASALGEGAALDLSDVVVLENATADGNAAVQAENEEAANTAAVAPAPLEALELAHVPMAVDAFAPSDAAAPAPDVVHVASETDAKVERMEPLRPAEEARAPDVALPPVASADALATPADAEHAALPPSAEKAANEAANEAPHVQEVADEALRTNGTADEALRVAAAGAADVVLTEAELTADGMATEAAVEEADPVIFAQPVKKIEADARADAPAADAEIDASGDGKGAREVTDDPATRGRTMEEASEQATREDGANVVRLPIQPL
jgi:hypothetical protein